MQSNLGRGERLEEGGAREEGEGGWSGGGGGSRSNLIGPYQLFHISQMSRLDVKLAVNLHSPPPPPPPPRVFTSERRVAK